MIENSRKLSFRLLTALALAAAGCSVSASGQVPCVDDSSCPADYPSCKSGFCVEATGGSTALVSILGVPGKAATDPVRGTITVQVTARADSGVKSLSLTGGGKTFTPAAGATGPVFSISVDTTTLTDGTVSFTATLTPGDATAAAVTSTAATILVDNTAPTLSSATLAAADLAPGGSVALDVTASEALASISGSVTSGSTSVALADSTPGGTVHHLIATLPSNAAAGTYTISVTATDLAGNTGVLSGAPSVIVHAPFALAASNLTLATTAGVTIGGAPGVTTGNDLNVTVTLPTGVVLASGAKPTVTSAPNGGAQTALTVSGTGPSYTATYHVAGTEADGSYQITATITDAAGNTSSFSKAFVIDKTAPTVPGGIVLATPNAGPNLPVSFSFAVSEVPAAFTATVNGHNASCGAAATSIACTYAPTGSDVGAGTVVSKTIAVNVKDALGNATPASTSVTLDAQAPTFSIANDGVGSATVNAGSLLSIDVTPSETLSAFGAAVISGSSCAGTATGSSFSDIASPTGSTRHLGFAVTATTAPGDYTLCLSGTDLAANVATTVARTFHVFGAFSFAANALVLSSPGSTADGQGFPLLSSQAGHKQLSGTLTLPAGLTLGGAQLGSHTPVYTISVGSGSPTTGQGTTSITYQVGGADAEGLATVTVSLTDVAGNTATTSATFDIDQTSPALVGGGAGIVIAPQPAGFNKGFLVTFSSGEPLSASQVVAKVGGNNHVLTCAGSTEWSCGGGSSTTVYTPVSGDTNSVTVTLTDTVGNSNGGLSNTYTLDTTNPTLGSPVLSATSGVTPGQTVTLCVCPSETLASISGVIEDSSFTVIGAATEVTQTCSGTCSTGGGFRELSFVMPSSAASGSYTFNATGTDLANNTGTAAPAFTVNGTFSISNMSITQNPSVFPVGSANGAPAFMGPANAGQFNCTVAGTTQGGTNGDITVTFTKPGNVTLKTPLDSTGGVTVTMTDSANHSFTLQGTATNPSGQNIQLKTCIPSAAAGFSHDAADGIATLSVVATSSTNNVSNALNATVFIKSNAPQVTGSAPASAALVGPSQNNLSFSFGMSEVPASTPTFSFVLPGSAPDNNTPFNCSAPSGLSDTCSKTLSGSDTSSTSGSFASPTAVSISVTMLDAVGNKSVTSLPGYIAYDGSTPNTASFSLGAFSPASFGGSTTATATSFASSQEDLGPGTTFRLLNTTTGNPPTHAPTITAQLPCGFTTPCAISISNLQNDSANTNVTYKLQVKAADVLGNTASSFFTVNSPTFSFDQTLPTITGSFTMTDTENGKTCTDTFGTFTTCNTTPKAVLAVNTQHVVFSGTASFPGLATSLSAAALNIGATACGGASCGTTNCNVNTGGVAGAFTCTLAVSSAASTTNIGTSFTLTDNLGNVSGTLTGPQFSLDNATETVSSVVATNSVTGGNSANIYVGAGVEVRLTASSNRTLAKAAISATSPGNLASAGSSSCSVSGTSISCSLVVSASATAVTNNSGSITIQGTDTSGNVGATASQALNVNVTAPTLGTLTPSPTLIKDGVAFTISGAPTTFNSIGLLSASISGVNGGSGISTATGNCDTTVSCTVTTSGCSSSPCTTNAVNVTAVDKSGMSLASPKTSGNFTVDDRAPTAGALTTSTSLPLVTGASPNHVVLNWGAMGGSAQCATAGQCSITSSANPTLSKNVTANTSGSYTTVSTACSAGGDCLPDPTQATVYTLTVNGSGGQVATSTLSVSMAPVIGTFTAPATVTSGGASNVPFTISVTGVNCTLASACSIARSDGANIPLATLGAFSANTYTNSTLTATTVSNGVTYTLSVTDVNNVTVTKTITVQVVPIPFALLTETTPSSGKFTTSVSPAFSYSVADAACGTPGNCAIHVGSCGGTSVFSISANGNASGVNPTPSSISSTTTYVLCVQNAATTPASASSSVAAVQTAAPVGVTFAMHVGSSTIGLAATGVVTFDVAATSGVTHAVITGGGLSTADFGPVTTTQNPTLAVPGTTTTYTLTAQNDAQDSGGTVTKTATVVVSDTIGQTSLASVRFGAAAVRLPDGRVLITGGSTDGTLANALTTGTIYDPSTGVFSDGTGNPANVTFALQIKRAFHTATLVKTTASYKVLVEGGNAAETKAELITIPAAGTAATSAADANVKQTRCGHTATLVTGNSEPAVTHAEVFLAGGTDCSTLAVGTGATQNQTELWTDGSNNAGQKGMTHARAFHTATVLADGDLLIAGGGTDAAGSTATAQIYAQPFDGNSNPLAEMTGGTGMQAARAFHSATLLKNNKVMLVGGATGTTPTNTIEIYTSGSAGVNGTWASTSLPTLTTARADHQAVLLNSGVLLIIGGDDHAGSPTSFTSSESYDSGTNAFAAGPSLLNARKNFFAVPLSTAVYNSDGQLNNTGMDGELFIGGGIATTSTTEAMILP